MNSYASVDGLPCAGSREILTDLLRGELGFEGVVVADYFAVDQLLSAHRTAGDRRPRRPRRRSPRGSTSSSPRSTVTASSPDWWRAGRLAEHDHRHRRRAGAGAEVPARPVRAARTYERRPRRPSFDTPEQRSLARRVAARAVVRAHERRGAAAATRRVATASRSSARTPTTSACCRATTTTRRTSRSCTLARRRCRHDRGLAERPDRATSPAQELVRSGAVLHPHVTPLAGPARRAAGSTTVDHVRGGATTPIPATRRSTTRSRRRRTPTSRSCSSGRDPASCPTARAGRCVTRRRSTCLVRSPSSSRRSAPPVPRRSSSS